jgi:hypothetical protein
MRLGVTKRKIPAPRAKLARQMKSLKYYIDLFVNDTIVLAKRRLMEKNNSNVRNTLINASLARRFTYGTCEQESDGEW